MADFWKIKTLAQMSSEEWERLCDGCGLCCLVKVEDEDDGKVYNTMISCRLLDTENCRCSDYENRLVKAPMCIKLTLENLPEMHWLPDSCAYKRLYSGDPLPDWHPLITKNKNSVHDAGVSAKWFAQSEEYVHPEQLIDFVIIPDEK